MAVRKARSIIRGRYQLESMIGEGGMASVWRARDLTLARPVAVKLLFARDDRDRNLLIERFLREARIAASLQHRNVIQIVDFGTTEDDVPFMVMELLEGEPLSARMHREHRLPLRDAIQIASLTLRGLAAVHATGIIHRDLKPDNIYLKREGDAVYPKILDFGISRSVEPQSGRRSALTTREGMIIGTPEYMSPEQARGVKDIDPRTDLYSMGVILYEALSGRLPFYSENIGDLIIQIVTGSAPALHELDPRIPIEVSDVVQRAMARSRDERFSSATEMQTAILQAAEHVPDGQAARHLSDMPPSGPEQDAGTRPLTLSELGTLELTELSELDSSSTRPTSDAFGVVPPVTQTLQTLVHGAELRRRSRWARWALPLAATALVAYTAIMIVQARTQGPTPPTALSAQSEHVSAAAPQTSTIQLTGLPSDAGILLDGQPSGAILTLTRSARGHLLEVTAPTKQPYRATITPDRDKTIEVSLVPQVSTPKTEASKLAGPRAKARPRRATAKPAAKQQQALRNLDF